MEEFEPAQEVEYVFTKYAEIEDLGNDIAKSFDTMIPLEGTTIKRDEQLNLKEHLEGIPTQLMRNKVKASETRLPHGLRQTLRIVTLDAKRELTYNIYRSNEAAIPIYMEVEECLFANPQQEFSTGRTQKPTSIKHYQFANKTAI